MATDAHVNRRQFMTRSVIAGVGLLTLPGILVAGDATDSVKTVQAKKERPPALAPELVLEFVKAGHSDLEKVKELLTRESELIYAAWDWGGGDFETALGGAGHMGRKDIAEFLIASGARMELHAFAMLGKLEVVKAILESTPIQREALGPHGITLKAHARKGGEDAAPVLAYLEGLSKS